MERLRDDLDSGRWHDAHTDLLTLDAIDAGFRVVIADWAAGADEPSAMPNVSA